MLLKNGWNVVAVIILLLMASAALAQTKVVEEIVARVNGDIILKSELESRKAAIKAELAEPEPRGRGLAGAQLEQAFEEESKVLLRNLIDETLLLQQAKEMGLSADLEVLKAMERLRVERKHATTDSLEKEIVDAGYSLDEFKQNIKTRYLTEQVMQREVYSRVIITNEEMRKYYDANIKKFDRPAGIRIREISVYIDGKTPEEVESQRKKIDEALAAIKKGDDFGEVAAKYSESGTAQDGGDLGFIVKGELNATLDQVTAKLAKGQTSDVLKLSDGFMILKVEDKHDGGLLSYELAQREVQNLLWNQAIPPKIREYLTKLRTDGFIEIRDGYVDAGAPPKTAKVADAK